MRAVGRGVRGGQSNLPKPLCGSRGGRTCCDLIDRALVGLDDDRNTRQSNARFSCACPWAEEGRTSAA